MPASNTDRDIINDPVELAAKRLVDQAEDIAERLLPKDHLRPGTRMLHERGLTIKGLQDHASR
jgi:hypothetical protein